MKRLVRKLVRMVAIGGAIAVVIKAMDQFRGNPDGVGSAGFSFDDSDDDPYAIDEASLGGDVHPELLERLVCPLDKGSLQLTDGRWLVNPRNGYRYPISDGIPVMLVEVGERYRDPSLVVSSEANAVTRT